MSDRRKVCKTCRFWDESLIRDAGTCRKNPPVIVDRLVRAEDFSSIAPATCWPETNPEGWCGEWFKGVRCG